jgi:RNA-directed DNA polymerase
VERAAIQQSGIVAVDDPGPPGFGSFEKSRGFYHHFAFALPFGLASTRAGVWQCRPAVTLSGRLTSSARSRALAVPSFSGPLHQPRAGIPAGTDEMFVVLHLLSHGTSWRRTDFLGFSYGFRSGRSPHHALDALAAGIVGKNVNWVLDADFSDYFSSLDHLWLVKFLEHRIADRRVLRLMEKWLAAGVIEDGSWTAVEEGVPQGASVSPLLANVYAHYVLDLWAHQWRTRHAHGDVIIVRWADDFVVGFEHREDAERFWSELRGRLAKFGLELNAEKTRLIEFGRHAARDRAARGLGKPDTFQFLGFTHICAKTRKSGRFKLRRITDSKRMRAKLLAVKGEMRKRMHHPVPEQGRWLARVLAGHYNYYAVPDNIEALSAFRYQIVRHWLKSLRRRSQKHRMAWTRMERLADQWLPQPRILHPWPEQRFAAITQGRSPVR